MENILCYWKKCNKKSNFWKTFSALFPSICFWSHFYQSFKPRPLLTKRIFPTAIPFPALSILTILFDKQLMKSFENINILIKVKLLIKVLEKVFEKRLSCERKKIFWEEKRFFVEKNAFLEKKLFFGKKTCFCEKKSFSWKKTFFWKKKFFLNFFWKKIFFWKNFWKIFWKKFFTSGA